MPSSQNGERIICALQGHFFAHYHEFLFDDQCFIRKFEGVWYLFNFFGFFFWKHLSTKSSRFFKITHEITLDAAHTLDIISIILISGNNILLDFSDK